MSSQLEDFRKIVYYWVQQIPKGKVTSYGQIAKLAGYPRHARHVSKALGAADKALNLPWFRVIAASGKIAFDKDSDGYAKQEALLKKEGIVVKKGKIDLQQFAWEVVDNKEQNANKDFSPEEFFR